VPYFVRRDLAVDVGWILSKARNRWLLWKDKLGRMMWFETGRVELYVRQPANLGKAKQLICNGFTKTGLIESIREFEQVLASLKFRGAHYVFDAGYPLPKMTINAFSKSNGITIKIGDNSHPRALEVISLYPDWAERNENLLKEIETLLNKGLFESRKSKKIDYVF
jgi:hypothetical protein